MNKLTRIALVGVLLSSTPVYGEAVGWSVSELSGTVLVDSKGSATAAKQGTRLNAGDVVRTGKNSRVVLVRSEEYMVVAPGSRIEIATPEEKGAVTQVIEYFGNVLYKIKKKATPHFGVETPSLAAVVKGTTFSVTVGEEGSSVQVTEGAVEISPTNSDIRQLLSPGAIGAVEASSPGNLTIYENGKGRVISSDGNVTTVPDNETATEAEDGLNDVAPASTSDSGPSGQSISSAVSSAPVDLETVTGGMVSGRAGGRGMNVSEAARAQGKGPGGNAARGVLDAIETSLTSVDDGSGNGRPGVGPPPGHGNGNGGNPGHGNGNGGNPGHGNGNGGNPGHGNDNGGNPGHGNGNGGNPGHGNDNGGNSGHGNGNGNGDD